MGLLTRDYETAPCTVEISHKFESLHAHVRFDNGAVVYPGDEAQVEGPPVMAPYGEVVVEQRMARITRASRLERLWTRMTGDFEFMELCEFSFSEEATLCTRRSSTLPTPQRSRKALPSRKPSPSTTAKAQPRSRCRTR